MTDLPCLAELGLGAPAEAGTVLLGRNHNWSGRTATGRRVFLKQLRGSPSDARRRMRRSQAFGEAMRAGGLPSAQPLGACEEHLVLTSELIEDATSAADLAGADAFDPMLAAEAGQLIADLHGLPASLAPDRSRPALPDPDRWQALSLTTYLNLSGAEIAFWRLVQPDAELAAAVSRLLADSDRARHTPAHCDLRLDQLLRTPDGLFLTDGEEFRHADPARDIGSFAGEWLFRSIAGLSADLDDTLAEEPDALTQVIRVASDRLAERRPIVAAFWRAYGDHVEVEDGLAARATGFAGWHLLDRAVAGAARSTRLAAPLRAAMGVGRQALLAPARFAATIGLA